MGLMNWFHKDALSRLNALDDTPLVGPGRDGVANDGLQNFVTGMGTRGDKSTHSHYTVPPMMTRIEADAIYRTSWLGQRLVCTPADDMCRKWRTFKWDGMDKGKTSKVGKPAVLAEEKRVQMRSRCHEGIMWSREYGGAIIAMITKDAVRSGKPAEELKKPLDIEGIK